MTRVCVVDYGAGNLRSLRTGLERAGAEVMVTDDAARVAAAGRVLVPGVGAAGAAMAALERRGLAAAIRDAAAAGAYVFGICLGLQLLFEASDEDDVPCLGLLPGRAVAMGFADRVPHMGWNDVAPQADHPLARALPAICYFAHSYAVEPAADDAVLGTTELGGRPFASVAGAGRVAGTQFHPEKSGPAGRELLRAFLRWSDRAA
ncbi:MAG TPA: imidazole glycerol phosphate synthase subunit HisH [Gaiellales bacterium]|nr:imidazole glycerol phosphate synthase subunit HisH [Gaiellales bacterium]